MSGATGHSDELREATPADAEQLAVLFALVEVTNTSMRFAKPLASR